MVLKEHVDFLTTLNRMNIFKTRDIIIVTQV